ncbi:MAG: tryptophan-rich sensory protein [Syntrophales bacterium]|nr:tryptophan-rich sensory protein [Syntrophales bacterium]
MNRFSRQKEIFGLVAWLAVTFAAAAIGSAASVSSGPFYMELVRPGWAPPPYVFGPVWTALYLLMGCSAWLVWRRGGFFAASTALTLYLLQLAANALWTWLFFRWHLGVAAFAEVLVLWVLIVATMASFRRVSLPASMLLIPYLAWVSFAAILNYTLWQLNPQILG